MRDSDTVARLGSDEFCIILQDWSDIASVALVAGKILAAMASPFDILDHTVQISASIGIAQSPQDANMPEDLIKTADQAMYTAKSAERNHFSFFSPPNKLLARSLG